MSEVLAHRWGADGFAKDASNAVKEAIEIIAYIKKLRDKKVSQSSEQ